METTEKPNSFGQRLKEIRLARSLKGVELARAVGITAGYLHDIEMNRSTPSVPLLARIASTLDVSVDYLLGRTDMPTHEAIAETNNDLLIQIPLLDEEMVACGYYDIALREIISYSRKFYAYSVEKLGGTYDKKHPPFAVRIKNSNLANNGIPDDCILIVNPALRPRPGEVCVVDYNGSLCAYRVQRINGKWRLSTDTESFKAPDGKTTVYGPVIEFHVEFSGRPKLLPREDSVSFSEAKQSESTVDISPHQLSDSDTQSNEPQTAKSVC